MTFGRAPIRAESGRTNLMCKPRGAPLGRPRNQLIHLSCGLGPISIAHETEHKVTFLSHERSGLIGPDQCSGPSNARNAGGSLSLVCLSRSASSSSPPVRSFAVFVALISIPEHLNYGARPTAALRGVRLEPVRGEHTIRPQGDQLARPLARAITQKNY